MWLGGCGRYGFILVEVFGWMGEEGKVVRILLPGKVPLLKSNTNLDIMLLCTLIVCLLSIFLYPCLENE